MRSETEVLDGLTTVLWTTEEDDLRASWSTHCELIEGDTLSAGFLNAGASSAGETEGADGHLGHGLQSNIVRHCCNNSYCLSLVCFGCVRVRGGRYNLRYGYRRFVCLA